MFVAGPISKKKEPRQQQQHSRRSCGAHIVCFDQNHHLRRFLEELLSLVNIMILSRRNYAVCDVRQTHQQNVHTFYDHSETQIGFTPCLSRIPRRHRWSFRKQQPRFLWPYKWRPKIFLASFKDATRKYYAIYRPATFSLI